jgi:hypothetical protein
MRLSQPSTRPRVEHENNTTSALISGCRSYQVVAQREHRNPASGLLSGERDGHQDRPGQTTYQFWLSPPEV